MNIACLLFIGNLQILMRDVARESQVDVAAPEQQIATPIANRTPPLDLDLALARMSAYPSMIALDQKQMAR